MGKTILIVGAGHWQVPLIMKARELGLVAVVTDKNPAAPGLIFADTPVIADTADLEKHLEIARRFSISGVATMASDIASLAVSYVAENMGLTGLPYEKALVCRNKLLVRGALAKCGLSSVKFRRAVQGMSADEALLDFDMPVVVKPADSWGSMGAALLTSRAGLDAAVREAVYYSIAKEAIIEEYIEGPEVSIEGICIGREAVIVGVTDKYLGPPPYFVEVGHTLPSQLSGNVQKELRDYAAKVLAGLGITDCAFHLEAKYSGGQAKLVEFGARLGGGAIASDLVPLSTGMDLVEGVIRLALGERPELAPTKTSSASIRFLRAQAGKVSRIRGLEEARAADGVVKVQLDVGEGDTVRSFRSDADRIGYVIAEGASPEHSARLAEAAAGKISIEVLT